MPVKIVTDSTADIPAELAQQLDISVVPLYVRFGNKVYRDGVDISEDEFYNKLTGATTHPTTSQPTPADFAELYTQLSKETDKIISVHISTKISGTYNSALRGKEIANTECQIEVVDSNFVTMGLGLVSIAAARLAKAGEDLPIIMDEIKKAILEIRMFGIFDSLKYLLLGGRISKAKALVGTLLNVKPVITMRDGELLQVGLARTRSKGVERLLDIINNLNLQELAIIHSTTPEEASSLKERVSSMLDKSRIHLARLGPALGVHGGPGSLILAFREHK